MPEKQICFKNLDVVEPERFYSCQNKVEEFQCLIDNLNYRDENMNVNTYSRSIPRRNFLKSNFKNLD